MQVALRAAVSSLAAPPQAAAVPALAADPASFGSQCSSGYGAAGVSMLGALHGCSQVLPADTPLGGGVVLGCHYQVLHKPWLPLDAAVRQFKVHLSLMATKARMYQQQQQHTGPDSEQQPAQPQHVHSQREQVQQQQLQDHSQQQQQREQQQLPSQASWDLQAQTAQQQRLLEQPLLLQQQSDTSSSSNTSGMQQLLPVPGTEQAAVAALPPAVLHVAYDDAYSDSSLGPGTPKSPGKQPQQARGSLQQSVLQSVQRQRVQGST